MSKTDMETGIRLSTESNRQTRSRLDPRASHLLRERNAADVWAGRFSNRGGHELKGRRTRVREMVEHYDNRYPVGRGIKPIATPSPEGSTMARHGPTKFLQPRKSKTIGGGGPIGEGYRLAEAPIDRVGVVPSGIGHALPSDHIIQTGPDPGVSGPDQIITGGSKPAGDISFITL
jgi:hypothetical protein